MAKPFWAASLHLPKSEDSASRFYFLHDWSHNTPKSVAGIRRMTEALSSIVFGKHVLFTGAKEREELRTPLHAFISSAERFATNHVMLVAALVRARSASTVAAQQGLITPFPFDFDCLDKMQKPCREAVSVRTLRKLAQSCSPRSRFTSSAAAGITSASTPLASKLPSLTTTASTASASASSLGSTSSPPPTSAMMVNLTKTVVGW